MKTIKADRNFQIPGTDVVVESGDEVRVVQKESAEQKRVGWTVKRSIFDGHTYSDYIMAKYDFVDLKNARMPRMNAKLNKAIEDLVAVGNVKEFPTLVHNDNFFTDEEAESQMWILIVPTVGVFICNTEGYNYARYLIKIAKAQDINDFKTSFSI